MFSALEINSKAILVRDAVNFVLKDLDLSVDRMFLVGSYARGQANDYSDIDYLIQLKGGKRALTFPTWNQQQQIKMTIDSIRIHCIYGTQEAQESLRRKDGVRYAYKEIKI